MAISNQGVQAIRGVAAPVSGRVSGGRGVWVAVATLGGTGVWVGAGPDVLSEGTGVFVGGIGVSVGGIGVSVDGTGVSVGGTGVFVGGSAVGVSAMGKAAWVEVFWPRKNSPPTKSTVKMSV